MDETVEKTAEAEVKVETTVETKPETKVESKETKPSDAEAKLLKEVMEKKTKLAEKDAALEEANKLLKQFDGIDPAIARKLLADQAAAETAALEAKGEFERVKQMMIEAHKSEKESLEAKVAEKDEKLSQAERTIADLTVGAAFSQSAFISSDLVLTPAKARQVYGAYFDVDGGRVVAFDKPKGEANRTKLVDASGDPLGFEAAIKKLVDSDPDRDSLIRSKLASGAGSTTVEAKVTKETSASGVSRIAEALAARKK